MLSRRSGRALKGRRAAMSLGAADQAVVSLASFLFLVIAARYLGVTELGLSLGRWPSTRP